jgi:TonB-dependent starch-binding outer membrane protein SusC
VSPLHKGKYNVIEKKYFTEKFKDTKHKDHYKQLECDRKNYISQSNSLGICMKHTTFLVVKFVAACLLLLTLTSTSLLAQGKRLTGNVSDDKGSVPGASVVVKGTTNGAVTDIDGNFAIDLKADNATIMVSSVGYSTQEIAVGTQTTLNIVLVEDVSTLSEVVVTGYGADATKRQTTGAVSTVKSRDLKAIPSGNVEQQLQGRVSGVTVITNGQPGTTSIIRVRGFGALGGNEPLYIVDGVPVESTNFLSPDDIETTTVLKDAAAASIYGARAANGVIIYTTKKGSRKGKKLEVSYDGMYGVTDPGKGQEMLNPTDFATWTWNALRNTATADGKPFAPSHPQFGSGQTPVLPDYINVGGASVVGAVDEGALKAKYNIDPTAGSIYQVVKADKAGTDWYGAITRQAPIQRHNLGFSGGSEASRFYVGLGAQNQDGILLNNSFKRYDFRVNTEFDLTSKFRIGENLQFTYRSVLGQTGGNGGRGIANDENDILQAFRMPSIIPVYDVYGGYAGTAAKGFNNPRNPVASRDGQVNDRNFNANGFGNVYAELDVLPGLTLRSSLGGQYNNFYSTFYSRLQYENSENNASFSFGEGGGYVFSWVNSNTANYKKKFGVHEIDVLGGVEALNTGKGRVVSASGLSPFSKDVDFIDLSASKKSDQTVGSGALSGGNNNVNFFSVFGRANYSFNDKYYVTAVVRRDGSSRFGANNRYGIFPAFSAAWRVTAEDFMKSQSLVTDLKVRGGWGQMGNSNNVNPFNQFSLYALSIGTSVYDINGTNNSAASGFYRSRIGNPNAKWETSTTTNIGFDATLLSGKIEFIADIWTKNTTDLLLRVPLLAPLGSSAAAPAVNVATMLNKGIDLQLINRGKIAGNWNYEVNLTGAFLKNEITKLAPESNLTFIDGPGLRGVTPVRNSVGQGISNFFGYKVLGYFKDKAEVDGAPKQEGAGPGRFRFEDNNGVGADGKLTGKPDGKVDAADRTNIGSPVPKFTGGLNLLASYKGFEIAAYLYTSLGNKIFNFSKWYTDFYPSFTGAAISARVKDSWSPTNLTPSGPIFEGASNFSTNTQSNSWYVEDGSYLRLQNVGISYNLPTSVLKGSGIKRAKVGISTNNILTLSGYSGLDPAVGGNVDENFGIDVGNYPVTRSVLLVLNIGF